MPSYAVIGGSRGIGLETVRQLAAVGHNTVFVTVRNIATSTHLATFLSESGATNVHVLQADSTDHRAMKAAAAQVAEKTGGTLDVLINNAGLMGRKSSFRGLTDFEDEDELDPYFMEAFQVNVLGFIHSVNAFLPLLRKGSAKKIALISSGAGDPELIWKARVEIAAAYGVTKAAANMAMTKYAALLESEGFVVIALAPGHVDISATAIERRQPNPERDAAMARMAQKLSAVIPNFNLAPLSPSVAVNWILKTIDHAGPADTGSFIQRELLPQTTEV